VGVITAVEAVRRVIVEVKAGVSDEENALFSVLLLNLLHLALRWTSEGRGRTISPTAVTTAQVRPCCVETPSMPHPRPTATAEGANRELDDDSPHLSPRNSHSRIHAAI